MNEETYEDYRSRVLQQHLQIAIDQVEEAREIRKIEMDLLDHKFNLALEA